MVSGVVLSGCSVGCTRASAQKLAKIGDAKSMKKASAVLEDAMYLKRLREQERAKQKAEVEALRKLAEELNL